MADEKEPDVDQSVPDEENLFEGIDIGPTDETIRVSGRRITNPPIPIPREEK